MRPLPVGTVTLLFSDIEGSTSMLTGLGSRWGEALSAHRAIVRGALREHGGLEMGTEGDSFFVVFTSANDAVLAAMAAQQGLWEHSWPEDRPVRVRMGLHTGEPERHDGDYIGIDVHRAARIASTAHGGQTVLSAATHALAEKALAGLPVRDLGWHRLKDLPSPEHLYDVTPPGLPTQRAPLRSLGAPASLPAYATELVGRSRELQEVAAAVMSRHSPLVTITGPGGTGKTRLAVAVACQVQDHFPGAVFFVALHTARDSSAMWSGISDAIGVPADAARPPRSRVLQFLHHRSALLVLDNLEQAPGADLVASDLLGAAPGLTLLATSRRPLHLTEEQLYPLAALPVPGGAGHLSDIARNPAVELFVQRARLVRPGFALTGENAEDVAALCQLLDGLPLAIELAAARCRLLGPRALVNRVDTWFGEALPMVQRPERQRALAAAIAWSHDMLAPADQRVFRRMGVFAGSVRLDAVAEVADVGPEDTLDVVGRLVDASLAEAVDGADGEPRVHMLETIRRFARQRLEATKELEETRLRHARWCLRVGSDIAALLDGPHQMGALDRMEAVNEDIRSALDWCLETTDPAGEERFALGLQLLEPMDSYWYRFGYIQEGRRWHERAVRLIDGGDHVDSTGIVDALHGHGVLAVQQNDLATGTQALERALRMAQRLGDLDREARESNGLGIALREGGNVEGARELIERSVELARLAGNPHREANALGNMVQLYLDTGDYGTAAQAARRAVAVDEALGNPWGVAIDKANLATVLLLGEGSEAALHQLVDVAPGAIALGDAELAVDVIDTFAAVWAARGDGQRSAAMLGAADAKRHAVGIPRPVPDARILDRFIGPVRAATPADEWRRAYDRGRALTVEAAVAEGSAPEVIAHRERRLQGSG